MKFTLSVRNFSCIERADIDLLALTVLIGPQASGKSVLSKLAYFCFETVRDLVSGVYQAQSLEDNKADQLTKFRSWFPPSAWGGKAFQISFQCGEYFVHIHRARSRKDKSLGLRLAYPDHIQADYIEFIDIITATSTSPHDDPTIAARRSIDTKSKVTSDFEKRLVERVGIGINNWQMFIPAGRSFFTSQYRTTSTFSKAETLDPLLIEFGRLYGYVKDQGFLAPRDDKGSDGKTIVRSKIVRELLGGDVILDKDSPVLLSDDGRMLPFSFLSSGQQELLPLLLTIELFGVGVGTTTYIEEPEAHLFPQAQSELLKHLVSLIKTQVNYPQLFMTTHSPYILARINNLIKAGQLGLRDHGRMRDEVKEIVPIKAWISEGLISAYAIEKGRTKSIIDSDGFIDAEYLDDVSGDISHELSRLIQIELDAR